MCALVDLRHIRKRKTMMCDEWSFVLGTPIANNMTLTMTLTMTIPVQNKFTFFCIYECV